MKTGWFILLLSVAWLHAAEAPRPEVSAGKTNAPSAAAKSETRKEDAQPPVATIPDATHKPVLTTNTLTGAGESVRYVTETGMLPLLKPDGPARAPVFYIGYARQRQAGGSAPPVTFCFNGAPGSSSVWLHLGALGPRRVKMLDDGMMPPPPYQLVDNEQTWLDQTDLVFIDPVGTGYSRAVKRDQTRKFLGLRG